MRKTYLHTLQAQKNEGHALTDATFWAILYSAGDSWQRLTPEQNYVKDDSNRLVAARRLLLSGIRGATPGMKKDKFSTGVWKTVLQNTNRPCGVDSHGRFAFLGVSYPSGQPEKARSQALLDLPPAVGGQTAFVQVFVQVLPQRVWQREGEAVLEGGAALGNVKQAHDRARFFLVELPGGI